MFWQTYIGNILRKTDINSTTEQQQKIKSMLMILELGI